ncbi:unnamed protein product [Bursaphelenchus xylophilus]|uniref:(pine wood nematode) hypothetical protein n=1 Tax=Bursaphelenchus xylophilus TaxID=6326 RepID=A0A1I7RQQ3_BURXY|nr:unnamed protein product [Bursaphelenchus xylophilus]CAG9104947.1 unnamed protein product [Bursaphelenchus xylophilus]
MRLLLVLCALLANLVLVNATTWEVGGHVKGFELPSLRGRHKVKARLVQAGMWETTCGEVIVGLGGFMISCQKPWVSNTAHLYMFHRLFYGEQCRMSKFENLQLPDVGGDWELSEFDEGPAPDNECPTDYYESG